MTHLLLFVALLAPQPFVSPQEVFQHAEELYQEGRFAEAIEQYESLHKDGVVDGSVCYNLGNAYFKNGQLGLAILNYERALRLIPGDEDTKANLDFANELIVDVVQKPPLPSYVAWVVNLYQALDPDLAAVLLSLAFVFGGAATSVLILEKWPRFRVPAIYSLVFCGILALASSGLLMAKLSSGKREGAVVLAPSLDVRSGPGETNPQLAEIHEGLKISVLGGREGWFQVRLPNGLTGWVRETDVAII